MKEQEAIFQKQLLVDFSFFDYNKRNLIHQNMAKEDSKKSLPSDIEEGLTDPKNFEKICKMAENFGITGEGIEVLDGIFERVMKGELDINKISQEIENKFRAKKEIAQKVADSLNSEIFINYKEGLKESYEASKETPSKEAKEETPPIEPLTGKLSALEKEILEETAGTEEKEPSSKTEEEKDKVDDILANLSKELEKEKEERKALDEAFEEKTASKKNKSSQKIKK